MSTSKTISSNSAVNTDQNCNKDKAPAILLNGDIPAMDINTNGTDDMKTQKGIILENGTKICTPEHFPNVQEQNGQYGNGPHNQDFTTQTGEITSQSGEYTVPTGVFTGHELTAPFGCGREFVPHSSYILPQQEYTQISPDFPVQENQVTDMTQGQMSEMGQDDGGSQVQDQKYEFYIHIKAGEAFPVGNGEQVQYIHGPTFIRLLASSPQMPQLNIVHTGHGPVPLPSNMGMASTTMPTNVALTPTMQEGDNLQQGVYNTGHGIVQQQMYTQMFQGVQIYNQMIAYPNIPPHMPPHVTQNQAGMRPMQPHVVIPRFTHRQHSPPQSNDQSHLQAEQPRPVNQQRKRDDRTDKQREKLQRRLRDRYHNSNHPPSPQTSPRNSHSSRNDGSNGSGGNKPRRRTSPRSEEIEEDPSIRKKREILSCIESPEVTDILARSAHLSWNFQPSNDESSPNMERSKIKYEVTVSTQGRQPSIFDSDTETQFDLTDLKPATEYQASVSAIFENIRGLPSKPSSFTTSGCEPDEPLMPKYMQKNKNFLVIKWNAPNDNGSKIINYILETDKGISGGGFNEIFKGSQKQFRYTKLQPATKYSFQLKAVNEFGESNYSPPMHCYTSGTVPATPEVPSLKEAGVNHLELTWPPVESDVTRYILQMDDQTNKHGFKVVFNGDENSHTCKNLQRNTEYRFKLLANNDQGDSLPSEIVTFRTKPDSPQAPPKPTLKGKMHSDYFKVSWDPPRDNGGATITKYYLEISECQDENWVSYYSGPDREKTLNHLRPGGTYRLRVSCQSVGGISPPSDVSTFTTPAICPGPCFQPRVHGRPKANLLNLRWGPPAYDGGSTITDYSIEMTSADNDIAKEVHVGPATCLECTVNGLLPGRCYTFKLRAFNKVGNGHFSDPLEVRTGCGPPEPPTELRIETRLLSTTVWASWEKPYCNGAEITEYRLEKACEQNVFSMVYCGDQCSCEVRNLLPASDYQFRVQAINQAGSGPFSAVASITTPPSVPAPVSNLQLVDYSCDFLTVSWTEPKNYGCEIIAYNIYIGDGPALHLGNVNEYCIEDLEPDTKYRIRIRAVNDIGEGPFSTLLKAQTLPLPPDPPRLECVLYGHQSLKLKWGDNSRPSLENNQYSLEMEDKRGRFGLVYSGANMNYKVSKLTEQTEYRFRIYSSNDSGDGPYSEVYTFSTGKAPPGTMKSPKVINITPVSCEVQWQEISPLQDDKIYYHLENDYTKVYQGPDTKFTLINLTPNTEYRVRVCAVRLPADDSTDLIGPFSPGTTFTTSPQPIGSYNADVKDIEESQRQPMPDELMILIFVVVLVVCAIILACLMASYS